jgi:hypothetical protein
VAVGVRLLLRGGEILGVTNAELPVSVGEVLVAGDTAIDDGDADAAGSKM